MKVEERNPRKQYKSPELRELGALRDITLAGYSYNTEQKVQPCKDNAHSRCITPGG